MATIAMIVMGLSLIALMFFAIYLNLKKEI